jgi:hypothetical protein
MPSPTVAGVAAVGAEAEVVGAAAAVLAAVVVVLAAAVVVLAAAAVVLVVAAVVLAVAVVVLAAAVLAVVVLVAPVERAPPEVVLVSERVAGRELAPVAVTVMTSVLTARHTDGLTGTGSA